jgi:hypothetical protein
MKPSKMGYKHTSGVITKNVHIDITLQIEFQSHIRAVTGTVLLELLVDRGIIWLYNRIRSK